MVVQVEVELEEVENEEKKTKITKKKTQKGLAERKLPEVETLGGAGTGRPFDVGHGNFLTEFFFYFLSFFSFFFYSGRTLSWGPSSPPSS